MTTLGYAWSEELIPVPARLRSLAKRTNALDRVAHAFGNRKANAASYALEALVVAGPLALEAGALGRSKALRDEAVLLVEAFALATVADTITKYASKRPLPRVRALKAPLLALRPAGYRAFESGHVSIAAACLTLAAITAERRHGARRWPRLVAVACTLAIAAGRLAAGRHYPTDMLVGAISGTLVGELVARTHRPRSSSAARPPIDGDALPAPA